MELASQGVDYAQQRKEATAGRSARSVEALIDRFIDEYAKRKGREEAFVTAPKSDLPIANHQGNVRLALRKLGVELRHDTFADRSEIAGLEGHGPHLDDAARDRLWLEIDERFRFAVSFYGWNKVDLFMDAWKAAGFRIVGHLVFRKRYASSARFLRYEHEQAYLLAKGNPVRPARPIPDVIDFPYTGNRLHPTQKPVEALSPLIEAFTQPGELVLDPFSGSGSTLEAAQQSGRDWTGIELDNGHYHTASKRLAVRPHQRAAA